LRSAAEEEIRNSDDVRAGKEKIIWLKKKTVGEVHPSEGLSRMKKSEGEKKRYREEKETPSLI